MGESVVAMLAAAKKAPVAKKKTQHKDPNESTDPDLPTKPKLPPFARRFNASPADDAIKFKVGDSKVLEGTTWYFLRC